jgi:hypothetical protein
MNKPASRLPVATPCRAAAIAASPAISIRSLDTTLTGAMWKPVHGRVDGLDCAHYESCL